MEFKGLSLELKADGDEGVIEGYGSVFGVQDSYGDVVEAGSFAESLKRRAPKMLWQHRFDEPIGKWDEVAEDGSGLRMRGRIALGTTRGKEAFELIRMGAMDGLSIGFRTIRDMVEGNVRRLKEIDLYEVSLVTMPANALSTVTGYKSIDSERAFETFLRESGFSRWDAKIITAGGYKAWSDRRDAEGQDLSADQRDAEAVKSELLKLLNGVSQCRT
jgi:HK97 family phage prohead protease